MHVWEDYSQLFRRRKRRKMSFVALLFNELVFLPLTLPLRPHSSLLWSKWGRCFCFFGHLRAWKTKLALFWIFVIVNKFYENIKATSLTGGFDIFVEFVDNNKNISFLLKMRICDILSCRTEQYKQFILFILQLLKVQIHRWSKLKSLWKLSVTLRCGSLSSRSLACRLFTPLPTILSLDSAAS